MGVSQASRQTARQTSKQARQTDELVYWETKTQAGIQGDRQAYRQMDRQRASMGPQVISPLTAKMYLFIYLSGTMQKNIVTGSNT